MLFGHADALNRATLDQDARHLVIEQHLAAPGVNDVRDLAGDFAGAAGGIPPAVQIGLDDQGVHTERALRRRQAIVTPLGHEDRFQRLAVEMTIQVLSGGLQRTLATGHQSGQCLGTPGQELDEDVLIEPSGHTVHIQEVLANGCRFVRKTLDQQVLEFGGIAGLVDAQARIDERVEGTSHGLPVDPAVGDKVHKAALLAAGR